MVGFRVSGLGIFNGFGFRVWGALFTGGMVLRMLGGTWRVFQRNQLVPSLKPPCLEDP